MCTTLAVMQASVFPLICRSCASYNLVEGGIARWDKIKEEMGDHPLRHYQQFVKTLAGDNLVKCTVMTPLERDSACRMAMCVVLHRTSSGSMLIVRRRVMIRYPCWHGSFVTDGGFSCLQAMCTAPGRAAAIKMFDEMGMD